MDWDVVVVGAGAAGLLAATRAAERGRRTLLLEKNKKPGVKILMSGGTRCNLTHATDSRDIVEAFGPPGRFLYSALAALSPQGLVDLIEAEGVPTKVESTGKIFPVSNKAADVLGGLLGRLERSGCRLALGEPLLELERGDGGFRLVTPRQTFIAAKVVIGTGGQSYPGCGTTGDAYRWAARLGHTIVAPRPALVPVTVDLPWVHALKGVTVPDVCVRVVEAPPSHEGASSGSAPKYLAEWRGSFLFTHFGLSGPAVLDVSRAITGHSHPTTLALECDFLPALAESALDELIRRESMSAGRRQLASVLTEQLPRRLCETLLSLAGLSADRKAGELSKPERAQLVRAVKRLAIPVSGTLEFKKAEVTAGGIALDEVDSRTLESKIVPKLYIAGEALDLDGPIGGYNFQAAFSTGYLAGESV